MHLAEGMLPLDQAVVWTAAAVPAVLWSMRGEQRAAADTTSSLVIAGATSLLFAATLFPMPVPIVGATSHVCLTPVLALIVGVRRIVWPTFFVLLLQAVFFAHGGLTTLGVNTVSLGVLGPWVAIGLWTGSRALGVPPPLALPLACAFGSLSVYLADALALAAALSDVAAPLSTFTAVSLGFAPVQGPLAVLEGMVSLGIVRLLALRRPDLLPAALRVLRKVSVPGAATLVAIAVVTSQSGCEYVGIDETVFAEVAASAGRPPAASPLDASGGELGLAASILVLFGLGFAAGRSWERLLGERDALPR